MGLGSNMRGFGHYKYRGNGNMQRTFNSTHKNCPAQFLALRETSQHTWEFYFLFSPPYLQFGLTALWRQPANIFSLDWQHCCRRTDRPWSIFSLDWQHCDRVDWLSILVSAEEDFRIPFDRGHLISFSRPSEVLPDYCIRHVESRIWIVYFVRIAALSSGSRTQRPRGVPSSVEIARYRSWPRASIPHQDIFYSLAEPGRRVGTPRTHLKDSVSLLLTRPARHVG